MSNKNYADYYIETLTNTMTDAIIRNVSLQASVRVSEDNVNEFEKTFELLDAEIGQLKDQLEKERRERNQSDQNKISSYEAEIQKLNSELSDLKNQKSEYENTKQKVQHIDTFRQQLVECREESKKMQKEYESIIDELNKKIEYLQLTPAKRKKIDELVTKSTEEITKDGGTF